METNTKREAASRELQEMSRFPINFVEFPNNYTALYETEPERKIAFEKKVKDILTPLIHRLVFFALDKNIEAAEAKKAGITLEQLQDIRNKLLRGEDVDNEESANNLSKNIEIALNEQPVLLRIIRKQIPNLLPYVLERAKMEMDLEEKEYIDPLTGGFSKKGLEHRFDIEKTRLKEAGENKCLILIEFDINSFKRINDDPNRGHAVGDEVIKDVVHILQNGLRKTDTVGRRSGDEFTVILPGVELDQANTVLQKVAQLVGKVSDRAGSSISISGGARIITSSETLPTYKEVSDTADYAGLIAKIKAPGKIIPYSTELKPDLSTKKKQMEWATLSVKRTFKRKRDEIEQKLANSTSDEEKDNLQEQMKLLIQEEKIAINRELKEIKRTIQFTTQQ